MKAIVLDLSGKVDLYDQVLFKALKAETEMSRYGFLAPGNGLLSLVPKMISHSENIIKRLIKDSEGLLNYWITCIIIAFSKPDVLHMQWLPFMEVVGWENSDYKIDKTHFPKDSTDAYYSQCLSSQYEQGALRRHKERR